MIHFIKANRWRAVRCLATIICAVSFISHITAQEVRNYDGFGNNRNNHELGTAGSILATKTRIAFSDGFSTPAAPDRTNPRVISNYLFAQDGLINDKKSLSDYTWVFGQFLDHDLTLVLNASPQNFNEVLSIMIPEDDQFFTPGTPMFMMRSAVADGTGTGPDNPRKFVNEVSSFLDGSGIYGSDEHRAAWLRTFIDGKLKVSSNNLLPWNTISGEFNDKVDPTAPFMGDDTHSNIKLYVAGDIRTNENPLLIAMHTLFVREHNRLCDELKLNNPTWSDEQLYQQARRINVGILQSITFNEWLPSIGIQIPSYSGYNEIIDPSISNLFSAAAFRIGHTLINSNIIRMDNKSGENMGNIRLKDAFFNPFAVNLAGGIDPFLKGMATQVQQELDCHVIDDVRNFLFGAPDEGGLDLPAININRGRERGLADYNAIREDFGLPRVRTFLEICSNPIVADKLEALYGSVDNIDPWVGILAEDHMKDAIFGELAMTILERQFKALRDGDRFYFENDGALSLSEKKEIRNTTFQSVVMRNTDIKLMQDHVFVAMKHEDIPDGPHLNHDLVDAEIYPNPVTDASRLKIYSKVNSPLTITMYDNLGRIISVKNVEALEGSAIIDIDFFTGLPRGAYNLKVENKLGIYTVVRAIL